MNLNDSHIDSEIHMSHVTFCFWHVLGCMGESVAVKDLETIGIDVGVLDRVEDKRHGSKLLMGDVQKPVCAA